MTPKQHGNTYVAGQFALIIALAFLPTPADWNSSSPLASADLVIFVLGWAVLIGGIIGLGRSLTANPVPLEAAKLKTTGLYAVVRHPIYFGLILLGAAMAGKAGSALAGLLFLGLVILLNFKARFEERLLLAKFPEYAAYAAKVGRLFPGVGKLK